MATKRQVTAGITCRDRTTADKSLRGYNMRGTAIFVIRVGDSIPMMKYASSMKMKCRSSV
jgi:hypothetical protein